MHLIPIPLVAGSLLLAAAKPENEAQKAAEQWLSLVDAGNFAASWKAASTYLQKVVSEDQWQRRITAVRGRLGNPMSRKLKSAKYTKSVAGAPRGEYVILQFNTSFSNKKEVVETVTPVLDKNGRWRVSGYYVE